MRTVLSRHGLPIGLIEAANRLVLKRPPFDRISTDGVPNVVKCLHRDLVNNHAAIVQLPDLSDAKCVGVFSDYGGDERQSFYWTYSFLIAALDDAPPVLNGLESLRGQHALLSPRREMAFKNLGYGPLFRALPDWLRVGDGLRGLLFTLLVDKRSLSVITADSKAALDTFIASAKTAGLTPPRTRETSERFFRIASCVAYWLSVLCRESQQVIWVTDRDSAAANSTLSESLRTATMSLAASIRPDLRVNFAFGADSELPDFANQYRELLSFPDLAAGALAQGISKAIPSASATARDMTTEHPPSKMGIILRWMALHRIGLKKTLFLCHPEGNGLRGAFGSLSLNEIPDNLRFIPVTRGGDL